MKSSDFIEGNISGSYDFRIEKQSRVKEFRGNTIQGIGTKHQLLK